MHCKKLLDHASDWRPQLGKYRPEFIWRMTVHTPDGDFTRFQLVIRNQCLFNARAIVVVGIECSTTYKLVAVHRADRSLILLNGLKAAFNIVAASQDKRVPMALSSSR